MRSPRFFIHGTLRSTIPGASLHLLDPAGVFFGPDATLEVDGPLGGLGLDPGTAPPPAGARP